MSTGQIPLTAIQDYADRHELGDLFVKQILNIDREYLEQQNKGQSNG